MSLVRLNATSAAYDARPVLDQVHFRLEEGERVGLIGKNGSGKTTLLKLILGQVDPTEGTVSRQRGLRLGYFSQFSELEGQRSTLEACDEVFATARQTEAELDGINDALGQDMDDDAMQALLSRQAELLEWMDAHEGWAVDLQIDTVLTRLGFAEHHRSCPTDALSGGWRNRAALAKILLEAPDLLLLDEPTNYLDIDGVAWLEDWVRDFKGAVLVVSHDRLFLDRVVSRVVEIDHASLQDYPGNFSEYVRLKRLRFKQLDHQFEHEETLLECEADDLARQRAVSKPGSRRPGRSKRGGGPKPVDRIINAVFSQLKMPEKILVAEDLSKGYDQGPLFSHLDLVLPRRRRLAILGPNGCGKSTLLRVLVQQEPPDTGSVTHGTSPLADHPAVAYYNRILEQLDPHTPAWRAIDTGQLARRVQDKKLQRFLELFRLSETDRKKRIGELSGGQRARVALARCLLSGASLLVLDEPTNHLDITATQVMERALVRYPGAVLFVSHDRLFVNKVASHRVVFGSDGRLFVEAHHAR